MSTFTAPLGVGLALQRLTPSAPAPALRFQQDPLMWIGVPASTPIAAFATGSVRRANGDTNGLPGNPSAKWTLFQLSPLPQRDPPAFKRIAGGLPIQLVLVSGTAGSTPADDDLLVAGEPLTAAPAGTGSTAFLSFAFQDRLCRDPLSWAEAIAASGACDPNWTQFVADLAALPGARNLRILDARGFPLTTGAVGVAIGTQPPSTAVLTAAGDGDTGVSVPAASQATVAASSAAHPIVAAGDVDAGAFEGAGFQLPPGARLAQVLDADQWLAAPDDGLHVQRWHPGSRLEPIVDGTPYFLRLVADMRATEPGGAVGFSGWAFVKGSLTDPTLDWPLVPGDGTTTFLNLVHELRGASVDVRLLVTEFLRFDSSSLDDFPELAPIVFAFYASLCPLQVFLKMQTDPAGYVVGLLAVAAVKFALDTNVSVDRIKSSAELSQDMVAALHAIDPTIATMTFYPAAFADNPLNAALPPPVLGHPLDDLSHIGCYHQKFAILKTADGHLVGYLGGIDINSNRPDTPLHRARSPYHDIQARVTGPAVADVVRTYEERAIFHNAVVPIPTPPEGGVAAAGSHLVQIARTYFKPKQGSPTPSFDFAPHGEATSVRTMEAAIAQARDYIYIEDQYFVPPDDYVHELLAAADRGVRALFVTVPIQIDMTFGGGRRVDVLNALASKWGSRLYVGAPLRRFLHETPALTTNLGRMRLAASLSQSAPQCDLAPLSHIPPPPFWAFAGSELLLVHAPLGAPSGSGDDARQTMEIVRAAGSPSWGAQPVEHKAGAPVLAVQIPEIYVHAKVLIVDDIFLFVGSSNVNRRSLYHDGELNSFVIPQHLKGDPDNPARVLRSRLMAEHTGLPPEMGLGLFADAISAIPYLVTRSWYSGAIRQPLGFFGSLPPDISLGTGDTAIGVALHGVLGTLHEQAKHDVWPLMVDPTTILEPPPYVRGPEYP